jgi:superfamily II DNA helicase RecQ
MKLQMYTVPIWNPDPVVVEINAFLAMHRIAQVERQFVSDGQNSAWSICITYLDNADRSPPEKRGSVDYREILPEAQFRVFAKLRILRKELSDKEGVPAYALFTNEHLAEMVRRSVDSLAALKKIGGVGQGRADKYGAAFLAVLKEFSSTLKADSTGAANGESGEDKPR